jgi:hypothetical protein
MTGDEFLMLGAPLRARQTALRERIGVLSANSRASDPSDLSDAVHAHMAATTALMDHLRKYQDGEQAFAGLGRPVAPPAWVALMPR